MQLNELRRELRFNKELLSLVETLKNVAGSQYHLLEKKKQRFARFMDAFGAFFRVVDLVDVVNPYVKVASDITGVVILTSDSGFMGGLNSGVIQAGLGAVEGLPQDQVAFVVIGEKGAGVISDMRIPFHYFEGISQDTIYEQSVVIKDYLIGEVGAGRMGRVLVAAPRALSFSAQEIAVVDLLPCGILFAREHEQAQEAARTGTQRFLADARKVIVESTYDDMVTYLAGIWVTSRLFEIFEDGKLAEFGARAMHLEGSLQKVEKEYGRVRQKVTKATHELVDKGMRESFAAKSTKRRKNKRVRSAAARALEN
ncbi:MAG: F0F1 ATP synthase subunit gamma [Kiritimatiellia bacterium]